MWNQVCFMLIVQKQGGVEKGSVVHVLYTRKIIMHIQRLFLRLDVQFNFSFL